MKKGSTKTKPKTQAPRRKDKSSKGDMPNTGKKRRARQPKSQKERRGRYKREHTVERQGYSTTRDAQDLAEATLEDGIKKILEFYHLDADGGWFQWIDSAYDHDHLPTCGCAISTKSFCDNILQPFLDDVSNDMEAACDLSTKWFEPHGRKQSVQGMSHYNPPWPALYLPD